MRRAPGTGTVRYSCGKWGVYFPTIRGVRGLFLGEYDTRSEAERTLDWAMGEVRRAASDELLAILRLQSKTPTSTSCRQRL